ncbi:MAG: shikimate dehydrogenase [Bacteroides sp.]|nr:shikimate dehydrogenase [Ruminococcus flavefaciens]MCM1554611.1 shikimate dehydrogenase [Bacteroides sp.]
MDPKPTNELTDIFGLIGHPLGHSFSAAYFRRKFEKEGLRGFAYLNFDLPDLASGIPALKADARCRGFNVTIPYKRGIFPFLDAVSPDAQAIGAVNTIRVEADGRWTGYNTDYTGFYESLSRFLPQGETPVALVLGNGGASQAVQYALYSHGIPYLLVCRQPQAVERKAFVPRQVLGYGELTPETVEQCRLLINTTRLGMFPEVDSSPDIPYAAVGESHCAFDLVYNPETTAFMRRCAERGAKTCNGLQMLHNQAEGAWRIWRENTAVSGLWSE